MNFLSSLRILDDEWGLVSIKIFLQSIYFNLLACMGVFVKFFNVYLKDKGLSLQEISFLYALVPLTHIIITFNIGYLANKFSLEKRILQIFTFLSFTFSIFYIILDSLSLTQFYFILACNLVTVLISLFRTPITPLLDSIILEFISYNKTDYGKIRLWGSVGFIFSVSIIGILLELFSSPSIPSNQIILYAMSFFFLLAYLSSLKILNKQTFKSPIQFQLLFPILRNKYFFLFIISALIHIISMSGYHSLFTLFILNLDYSPSFIGIFTVASVLSEVFLFHFSSKILSRFDWNYILSFCFLITCIRWFLLALFHHSFWIILLTQTFHAFSWGLFYVTSIFLIEKHFQHKFRTTGLAFFSTLSIGFGSVFGYLAAGFISQHSNYVNLFFFSSIVSFISFLVWSISFYKVSMKKV